MKLDLDRAAGNAFSTRAVRRDTLLPMVCLHHLHRAAQIPRSEGQTAMRVKIFGGTHPRNGYRMKIATGLRDTPLDAVGEHARRLEELGFDVLWCNETTADPFLVLAQMALGTERATVAPNVAIAFARSPFSMALAAWDIQRASRGRLRLGLGTQVRAHVERRFSAEFEHPAARVADYIHCLRAIWRTFQTGARPDYQGRFHRFTLINDFFNPGPIEHPDIPIDLAGVNERMCRAAGEAADGFQVHPMHSPGYLREVIRPALDEGARTRGMRVDDLEVQAPCFAISGETEAERVKAEQRVRTQVAFYASTPSYRAFLDYHGFVDIAKPLSQLMRSGDIAAMPALIPDALLEEIAIFGPRASLPRLLRERYAGDLLQCTALYLPPAEGDSDAAWREFVRQFRIAA